jgi:hypothetical protein
MPMGGSCLSNIDHICFLGAVGDGGHGKDKNQCKMAGLLLSFSFLFRVARLPKHRPLRSSLSSIHSSLPQDRFG